MARRAVCRSGGVCAPAFPTDSVRYRYTLPLAVSSAEQAVKGIQPCSVPSPECGAGKPFACAAGQHGFARFRGFMVRPVSLSALDPPNDTVLLASSSGQRVTPSAVWMPVS